MFSMLKKQKDQNKIDLSQCANCPVAVNKFNCAQAITAGQCKAGIRTIEQLEVIKQDKQPVFLN
jgi:hypothetical protein